MSSTLVIDLAAVQKMASKSDTRMPPVSLLIVPIVDAASTERALVRNLVRAVELALLVSTKCSSKPRQVTMAIPSSGSALSSRAHNTSHLTYMRYVRVTVPHPAARSILSLVHVVSFLVVLFSPPLTIAGTSAVPQGPGVPGNLQGNQIQTYQTHIFAPPVTGAPVKKGVFSTSVGGDRKIDITSSTNRRRHCWRFLYRSRRLSADKHSRAAYLPSMWPCRPLQGRQMC